MNASSISPPVLNGDNTESDSDTNPDQEPVHYQPISATDVGDSDDHHDGSSNYEVLNNGHCSNDISSLSINSDEMSSDEEGEEERMREAMVRALREDERRRNAPLTEENARRVMEAMRGVSFPGSPPDWAPRLDEDQWIGSLTTLRHASPSSASGVQ